jgi:hypothetical protein
MKRFRLLIALIPFFFSLTHAMETKQQEVNKTLNLKILSNHALESFVDRLYKPDNLSRCQKACKTFSDEALKKHHSTEFETLIKNDWEKEYAKNCGLTEVACIIWKKRLKESIPYLYNDEHKIETPEYASAAIEIQKKLEQFHSLATQPSTTNKLPADTNDLPMLNELITRLKNIPDSAYNE